LKTTGLLGLVMYWYSFLIKGWGEWSNVVVKFSFLTDSTSNTMMKWDQRYFIWYQTILEKRRRENKIKRFF